MGNGCFCIRNECYPEVKLDSEQDQNSNTKGHNSGLYNIAKYFNEGEKELNNKIKEKKNIRRILSHKKAKNMKSFYTTGDSKYELILKRLLEQKEVERNGPIRRQTIRKNNNKELLKMIKEVIKDDKSGKNVDKHDKKNNEKNNEEINIKESLLLNMQDKKNALKTPQGKKSLIVNNLINNKINKVKNKNLNNSSKKKVINNKMEIFEKNTDSNKVSSTNDNHKDSNYISDINPMCLPKRKKENLG